MCPLMSDTQLSPLCHSYSGKVVGNGLYAQRQNPEVKVRAPNPVLAEVKENLEHFIQVGWPQENICTRVSEMTGHNLYLRHNVLQINFVPTVKKEGYCCCSSPAVYAKVIRQSLV